MSISEDRDEAAREQATWAGIDAGLAGDAKHAPTAAKWGMAGLLLVYAGLGTYCLTSALGGGAGSVLARSSGSPHPQGVARSVAAALARPAATAGSAATQSAAAIGIGQDRGVKPASRPPARKPAVEAAPPPAVGGLTAVSAVAIGPDGVSDGDHPDLAPNVLDGHSGMYWVTHWYATAHFGNLQEGTGLLLDMGKPVSIKQLELALGGSPGVWGADLQIRIGDTPNLTDAKPVAVASGVGGWVSQDLHSAVTGRYVQLWFTKLPLDSWGTYQEHVYGVAVRGYLPVRKSPGPAGHGTAKTTSHTVHAGRAGKDPGSHGHQADRQRLGHPAGGHGPGGHPTDGHPTDGHPADGHPADGHPADGHPADGHPADGHPADGHPADGHPADGHPAGDQRGPQRGVTGGHEGAGHGGGQAHGGTRGAPGGGHDGGHGRGHDGGPGGGHGGHGGHGG